MHGVTVTDEVTSKIDFEIMQPIRENIVLEEVDLVLCRMAQNFLSHKNTPES